MHLSDELLVKASDAELSSREASRIAAHLAQCWTCRARQQELEAAAANFVRLPPQPVPSPEGPRALLKARLDHLPAATPLTVENWRMTLGVCCALLIAGIFLGQFWAKSAHSVIVAIPDPKLTPGATVLLSLDQVCSASNEKNKAVPVALQRQVFEVYGIRHAEPRAYEVDYLITPALGGAEDIHNLWPQSYSNTVWNARVKDDLEDRLRTLVCEGKLDLSTAQREIAGNWIDAYKKYFQTDLPR